MGPVPYATTPHTVSKSTARRRHAVMMHRDAKPLYDIDGVGSVVGEGVVTSSANGSLVLDSVVVERDDGGGGGYGSRLPGAVSSTPSVRPMYEGVCNGRDEAQDTVKDANRPDSSAALITVVVVVVVEVVPPSSVVVLVTAAAGVTDVPCLRNKGALSTPQSTVVRSCMLRPILRTTILIAPPAVAFPFPFPSVSGWSRPLPVRSPIFATIALNCFDMASCGSTDLLP